MSETTVVNAYATQGPQQPFEPFQYELGAIGHDEVEIEVTHCGICHSDLSMANNDWGMTSYPFVGGHEIEGRVAKIGSSVRSVAVGDRVGAGWFAASDLDCPMCVSGKHNLSPSNTGMIVGRHGGFADRVRVQSTWVVPIHDSIPVGEAGPLFCGGSTVWTPLQHHTTPTDRIAIVGIGGLGHMAVMFGNKWGCHVTAITTSESKRAEAMELGAHDVLIGTNPAELEKAAGSFDMVISTVNAPLDWDAYIAMLKPEGRLHLVGAVMEPIPVIAFSLIMGHKTISGSPVANPSDMTSMIDFAGRHEIAPHTEHFPIDNINDAFDQLKANRLRYRAVLDIHSSKS